MLPDQYSHIHVCSTSEITMRSCRTSASGALSLMLPTNTVDTNLSVGWRSGVAIGTVVLTTGGGFSVTGGWRTESVHVVCVRVMCVRYFVCTCCVCTCCMCTCCVCVKW